MTEKCKYCGWERPGGNYVHSRDACDDMREKALQKVVRAAEAVTKNNPSIDKPLIEALAELPEYWRGEG